jgi:tetratricopeptide (TPR) repeat protein
MSAMRIFVSHSQKDAAFCRALVQGLRQAGADVWYDDESLSSGPLLTEIQRELRERPVFLVILTKATFISRQVRRETLWAHELGDRDPTRILLPVTAGPIERSDFSAENMWLFLHDFKRIEAPGYQPYPPAEAIRRTLQALQLTLPGEAPLPLAQSTHVAQPKVFVSHSHKDDAFTKRLVADLRAAGADVWVDVANMGAGDFQERINDALTNCEWAVLVLTQDALDSKWVKMEVNAAIRLTHQGQIRNVLPIRAGPMDLKTLPPLWGVFNVFDATSDYPAARADVLRALGLSVVPQSVTRTLHALELTLPDEAPPPIVAQPAESAEDPPREHESSRLPILPQTPPEMRAWRWGSAPDLSFAGVDLGDMTGTGKIAAVVPLSPHDSGWSKGLTAPPAADGFAPGGAVEVDQQPSAQMPSPLDPAIASRHAQSAESADNLITRGKALRAQGKHAEALELFERATQLRPQSFRAWINIGYTLDDLKRYQEAVDAYDRALALDPNFAMAWKNKAISLRALGRTREAEAAERRVKELGG